jgi:hypothetical protein
MATVFDRGSGGAAAVRVSGEGLRAHGPARESEE